jgi:hypothetical protein
MVKIWDPATGQVTTLEAPDRVPPTNGSEREPYRKSDGSSEPRRTSDSSPVTAAAVTTSPVIALASNERGELAVVRGNGRVAILDADLEVICNGPLPAQPDGSAAWHPSRRQIAVGTTRGFAVFELRPLPQNGAK